MARMIQPAPTASEYDAVWKMPRLRDKIIGVRRRGLRRDWVETKDSLDTDGRNNERDGQEDRELQDAFPFPLVRSRLSPARSGSRTHLESVRADTVRRERHEHTHIQRSLQEDACGAESG